MNARSLVAPLLIALAALLAAPAAAAPRDDRGHVVGLSVSPLHLILPVFEAQAEIYVSAPVSVVALVGYGKVSIEVNGDPTDFDVFEIGGQARFYFYGATEEGAYTALEGIYTGVDGEIEGVIGIGRGVSGGPLLGYKWVWGHFLLDLAAGVQYLAVSAEASDGDETEEASGGEFAFNLNFNLGAAF